MSSVFHQRPEVSSASLRQVVGLIKKLAAKLGGCSGLTSSSSDTTCDRLAGLDVTPQLVKGYVIRSGIGSYDCEVRIGGDGGTTIVCQTLAPVLNDVYGVSQACMPVPGSCVLVYAATSGLARQKVARGIILGVIPENGHVSESIDGSSKISKVADNECPEGGVAQFTESGDATIATDKQFPYHGEFQCGRPVDIVPGEYGLLNHAGAGLMIGAVSTSIKGSEGASVRCSGLDDQVRIISGHYKHISSAGSEEIFNDGGFITVESFVSMYQPERLGVKDFGTKAFTRSPVDLISAKQEKSGISPLKPTQTAKKRLYRYAGYLGDIENVFVANPEPGKNVEDMESDSKDQGLLHYHIDSSGRFTMRSASGIMFERYDRIPIPKRQHYAWDPEGDKPSSGDAQKKKGFSLPKEHPMGIGLTLADMSAWWDHLSYLRFEQFSKDFKVKKQSELQCPDEDYDTIGKGNEDRKEYDVRHSYIGLTPNGGIVLRDAWGSEIVMADGRITLNAAANIEVRSGSSVVILGGDDVIAKAYNSVDITATEKDVRLKAQNNLQMVSMKRGVLIQSKAESDGASWSDSGEDLTSTGVVIKADKSSVALVGKNAELQGTEGVKIAAFKESSPSGNIILSGKQVSAVSSENIVATAGGTSGIVVGEQSAIICAPTVLAVGGQSAAQAAGNKMLIGIPVDVGSMYSELIAICKSYKQLYLDAVEWLSPFKPSVFSEIEFKFRTKEQYGTDKSAGIADGEFRVYEPSWAVMAEKKRKPLESCKTKAWEEKPDSVGEYPWPGRGVIDGNGYVTYTEQNIEKDGTENPTSGTATLKPMSFSKYHIREK